MSHPLLVGARPSLIRLCPLHRTVLPQLRSYAKKKVSSPAAKGKTPSPLPRTLKSTSPANKPAPKGTTTTGVASLGSGSGAPIYTTLADRLGAAGRDTILFAGYPKSFIRVCYGMSTLSFGWSAYDYYANILNPPEGLPSWVPKIHWFSLVTMGLVGLVAAYYPSRIVQKITAIPYRPSPTRPPTIKIALHKRPFLPLLPEKRIIVDNVNLLTLAEPLQPVRAASEMTPMTKLDPATRFVARLVGLPFKIFKIAKDTVTTANFVTIRLENGNSLMLMKDGWVWERRGIDKLFQSRKSYSV